LLPRGTVARAAVLVEILDRRIAVDENEPVALLDRLDPADPD
jgi:hypothetical protein